MDNPLGAHAGDLPNLTVKVNGRDHLDATSDLATLSLGSVSLFDADGSAIVIHAAPDGQSDEPNWQQRARVACGVIVAD